MVWRLYGSPARRGDPVAAALLAHRLVQPLIASPVADRKAAAALLSSFALDPEFSGDPAWNPGKQALASLLRARVVSTGAPWVPDVLDLPPGSRGDPRQLDSPRSVPELGPAPPLPELPAREPWLPDDLEAGDSLAWVRATRARIAPGTLPPGLAGDLGVQLYHVWRTEESLSAEAKAKVLAATEYWLTAALRAGNGIGGYYLALLQKDLGRFEAGLPFLFAGARLGCGLACLGLVEALEARPQENSAALCRSLVWYAAGRSAGWAWLHLGQRLREGSGSFPLDPVLGVLAVDRALDYDAKLVAIERLAYCYREGLGFRKDPAQASLLEALAKP